MKPGTWFDLAFCIAVLPALLLIFPIEEWAGWNAMYVLGYVTWLYANYFLHRSVSAPLILSGGRWAWTGAALIFISIAVTFLVSLGEAGDPANPDSPGLEMHQRVLWALFTVTTFTGMVIGVLTLKLRQAETDRAILAEKEARENDLLHRSGATADVLSVKSGYQDVQIPLSEIQYIESRGNYVCIHRDHGDDVIPQITLKALEGMVPQGTLLRVHRSFLIPAWRIEIRSANSLRLAGVDREIPVGRAHKGNLKAETT